MKYKIGDVFEFEIEGNKYEGCIIDKKEEIVLIEMYQGNEVLLTMFCWNDNLKNGKWKIVRHKNIPNDYEVINFWGQRAIDDRYFIIKSKEVLDDDNLEMNFVEKEKTVGLEQYGYFEPRHAEEDFKQRLKL